MGVQSVYKVLRITRTLHYRFVLDRRRQRPSCESSSHSYKHITLLDAQVTLGHVMLATLYPSSLSKASPGHCLTVTEDRGQLKPQGGESERLGVKDTAYVSKENFPRISKFS